jgi:hypothetical protein
LKLLKFRIGSRRLFRVVIQLRSTATTAALAATTTWAALSTALSALSAEAAATRTTLTAASTASTARTAAGTACTTSAWSASSTTHRGEIGHQFFAAEFAIFVLVEFDQSEGGVFDLFFRNLTVLVRVEGHHDWQHAEHHFRPAATTLATGSASTPALTTKSTLSGTTLAASFLAASSLAASSLAASSLAASFLAASFLATSFLAASTATSWAPLALSLFVSAFPALSSFGWLSHRDANCQQRQSNRRRQSASRHRHFLSPQYHRGIRCSSANSLPP